MKSLVKAVFFLFALAAQFPLVFAVSGGGGSSWMPPSSTPTTAISPTPAAALEVFEFNGKRLACGDLQKADERVLCRLTLIRNEGEQHGVYYVPEECRVLPKAKRAGCFAQYDEFQSCREGRSREREECIKDKIGYIPRDASKVVTFAKFKLYDLEYKAEELLFDKHVGEESVVKIIAQIERRKVEFTSAPALKERRKCSVMQKPTSLHLRIQLAVN